MTQEEEDLEEELRNLDIREDHGDDDSDVTPTNTPPSTPPILYIKKYPPVNLYGYEDKDLGRYSRGEDYDSRSNSSLSWGDDEFEGEATRQVSVLFDQLDSLLYKEKRYFSPLPFLENTATNQFAPTALQQDCLTQLNEDEDEWASSEGGEEENEEDEEGEEEKAKKDIISSGLIGAVTEIPERNLFEDERLMSSETPYSKERLLTSSSGFGVDPLTTPDPTPELQEECSSWVQRFPHYRVRGYSLDSSYLNLLDHHLADASLSSDNNGYIRNTEAEEEKEEEEVIAHDGDFYHLLPLVSFSSANRVKTPSNAKLKQGTSSTSRVCSGSSDPEVLKEQVLIMLFDQLWPTITEIIEPLLHQYARYVIEQSVQYSSLSREPSTRGSRLGAQTPARKGIEVQNKSNGRFLNASNTVQRPISGANRGYRTIRPISGIKRPSSAANRIQSATVMPNIHQEELQDLLRVSSKPLLNGEERIRSRTPSASTIRTRESSAHSSSSLVSLPSVATPRTSVQRPVSSKMANHLLTPMRVDSLTNLGDQRPSSTSSCNARARFQEKFQHLSRQGTIQESGNDSIASDSEEGVQEISSPLWSRHNSFLPPIGDNVSTPVKMNVDQLTLGQSLSAGMRATLSEKSALEQLHNTLLQSPVMTGEDGQLSGLSVRGTTLSAAHHPHAHAKSSSKHSWASGMRPVEPFLSWVVERVDNGMRTLGQDQNVVVKNSLVNEENKSNSMMRTKHFRRYSHH